MIDRINLFLKLRTKTEKLLENSIRHVLHNYTFKILQKDKKTSCISSQSTDSSDCRLYSLESFLTNKAFVN